MSLKKIKTINRAAERHWVGDGFPVLNLLSYQKSGADSSPFLLLDYAGPADFPSSASPRGVELHPHRGFETVTIVYQGEVEHRDNAGNAGKIGPGDVQWMTAARGILHEEMHGREFTKKGGTLEMVQLWVNLPAKDKLTAPHYQEISNEQIPVVTLDDNGSVLRVIAGQYETTAGAAKTFTLVNLWDLRLKTGSVFDNISLPKDFNTLLLVLKGKILLNNNTIVSNNELVLFEREGESIAIESLEDATILILNGEPINEPIVGQGPFVMNTREELEQAFMDYRMGRF